MLVALRDLFTRHRRKLIVAGVLVGGTYAALKFAQCKLVEFQERQAREFFEKTRRIQHFDSTERTCNQVILSMSGELYAVIIQECSTEALLAELRQNPTNKLELWEKMKIVAFTRLTTFIYASSMLVLTLRIQLNLLGGYLYQDIITEKKQISDELKQQYLSLIQYFLNEGGLVELVRTIRAKVVAIMKPLPLDKRFKLTDLEQLFWSLQMTINGAVAEPKSKLATFLLPPQVPEYSTASPLLQRMHSETLDLLETDDASTVCLNNICRGFSLTVDYIAECMGETLALSQRTAAAKATTTAGTTTTTTATATTENTQNSESAGDGATVEQDKDALLNINSLEMALAKIIPMVSGMTSKGFDQWTRPQNLATSLISFYVLDEKSKVLGANVYETFSSTS